MSGQAKPTENMLWGGRFTGMPQQLSFLLVLDLGPTKH